MGAALLQISGLTKTYNKRIILDNINMSVQEGTIVGLVGPNGVGKTTLMKCILELTPFSQGEIVVNGQTITARKKPKITEIGALIESPGCTPICQEWTTLDFIRMMSMRHFWNA